MNNNNVINLVVVVVSIVLLYLIFNKCSNTDSFVNTNNNTTANLSDLYTVNTKNQAIYFALINTDPNVIAQVNSILSDPNSYKSVAVYKLYKKQGIKVLTIKIQNDVPSYDNIFTEDVQNTLFNLGQIKFNF